MKTHIGKELKKLTLISIALAVIPACSSVNKYFGLKDDNFIEESVEKVIECQTGLDIDLTPSSPE